MLNDLVIPLGLLHGFALTLMRLAGIFAFLPIPGAGAGTPAARIVLALAVTMSLAPRWPELDGTATLSTLVAWSAGEAVLGLLTGLAVATIADAFLLGAQFLSLPAGYGYASTFDPNTNADSGILLIFAQLLTSLLFFATGFDRLIIRAFADSLYTCPPGTFRTSVGMVPEIIRLGTGMFVLAVRIALPIAGFLLLVDLALGVLGRINPHIQIINLSFPVKMFVALTLLAATLGIAPRLYGEQSARVLASVQLFFRAK
jgi:flagellar biosynthetic protein FliR